MKLSSLLSTAAALALFPAGMVALAQAAQDQPPVPGASQPGGSRADGRPMRKFPPPTNLKVLPKDLTGQQVHEIMETWAGSLGVHCDTCHAADPKKIGPNGKPRLNFADDSKDDKQIARIMYTMTERINADYISKAKQIDTDAMDMTVTCGTCHRGHKMPEKFVVPKEEGPGGPPPAGATPPATPPAN